MKHRVFALFFALFLMAWHLDASAVHAQLVSDSIPVPELPEVCPLTDEARAAIVRALAEVEFGRETTATQVAVYLPEADESWFPALPNVEFVLLTTAEKAAYDASCTPYHWLDGFYVEYDGVDAGFTRGTSCSSRGHTRRFVCKDGKWFAEGAGTGRMSAGGMSHCPCTGTESDLLTLPFKAGAYHFTECPVKLTDSGRQTCFRYVYSFRVETDGNGFVSSLKEVRTPTDHTLLTEASMRESVESWIFEPNSSYWVVFSVGTTGGPNRVSISSYKAGVKLRFRL